MSKKKGLSLKEIQRRKEQGTDSTLYCSGDGTYFKMQKVKGGYKL